MEAIEPKYYSFEIEQIYEEFNTDPKKGLTEEEAQKRLMKFQK